MIIKIGDQVFDNAKIPVMVVLTPQDKENINNMNSECTKYAVFPDDFGTRDQMHAWMQVKV